VSTETPNDGSTADDPASRNISLSYNEDAGNWSAVDEDLGVASVGPTREAALDMLDEAVALHTGEAGESVDSREAENEMLEDLGIDPHEVEESRDSDTEPPDFMR
jgi:predicted RNase H-like HicB family nuclease